MAEPDEVAAGVVGSGDGDEQHFVGIGGGCAVLLLLDDGGDEPRYVVESVGVAGGIETGEIGRTGVGDGVILEIAVEVVIEPDE